MEFINETLKAKVKYKFDIVVAGGGVAGIAAALAASRQGKKVLLLEKQYMLGGLATAGLVTIYLPLCDGRGNQISYGIAEELLKFSIKYGYEDMYPEAWIENGTHEEKSKKRYEVRYNAQLFAIAAEQLLIENGVKILYGTTVCSTTVEDGKIKYIIIENKSGRCAIEMDSVIDCTGDADVCNYSGEKTETFKQKNILAAWYYYCDRNKYDLKQLGFCDIPDSEKNEENAPELLINRRFEGIDAEEISEMTCLSHASILNDIKKERLSHPNLMPVTIATTPQIRMTRRISGKYTMTINDDKKSFIDSVGMFSNWRKCGPVYQLPFSALHGDKIKNLICAGRCISADDDMWDITRVIPVCAVSGEAAGTAASVCDDFTNIDINLLQKKLIDSGVVIKQKSK